MPPLATPTKPPAAQSALPARFASAVQACRDDAGLIDKAKLQRAATQMGVAGADFESAVNAAGCVDMFGRLSAADTAVAAAKAALLHLERPATAAEIADLCDRYPGVVTRSRVAVSGAVIACPSIVRAGYERWAAGPSKEMAQVAAFCEALLSARDDVGLADEPRLRAEAALFGLSGDAFEAAAEAAGCVRFFGRLAVMDTGKAAVKAALLHLGRPAAGAEIAELTGCSRSAVAASFTSCPSIVRAGYDRWAAGTSEQMALVAAFGRALLASLDDAGLVDEASLRAAATQTGITAAAFDETAARAGCVRLFGSLAARNTPTSAAKAALLHLGRSASCGELAEMTGPSPDALEDAVSRCRSIVAAGPRRWRVAPVVGGDAFAAAVRRCRDDVGLVDEPRLRQAAQRLCIASATFDEATAQAGCVRLSGHLAVKDTAKAAIKAALLALGRPATTPELHAITGRAETSISSELCAGPSFVRVAHALWTVVDRPSESSPLQSLLKACSDDVGLINEPNLRDMAEQAGIVEDALDAAVDAAGCVRLFGALAVKATHKATVKAAMLALDGPAAAVELADMTEMPVTTVRRALKSCITAAHAGRGRWVLAPIKAIVRIEAFAAAVDACRDDAGLLDEPRLRRMATDIGVEPADFDEAADTAGCVRLFGSLAAGDTVSAAAKAALAHLARPASTTELAQMTGRSYSVIPPALARCGSTVNAGRAHWVVADV